LQKRIITNYTLQIQIQNKSSITSLQPNLIPPYGANIPPYIFAHTDSTLMICQKLYGFSIFPVIDIFDSSSCIPFDVLKLIKILKDLQNIFVVKVTKMFCDEDKNMLLENKKSDFK